MVTKATSQETPCLAVFPLGFLCFPMHQCLNPFQNFGSCLDCWALNLLFCHQCYAQGSRVLLKCDLAEVCLCACGCFLQQELHSGLAVQVPVEAMVSRQLLSAWLQGASWCVISTALQPVALFFHKGLSIHFVLPEPNDSGRTTRKASSLESANVWHMRYPWQD